MRDVLRICACLLLASSSWTAAAQPNESETVAALRQEIAEMRRAYEARIAALEERLVKLEAQRAAAPAAPAPEDELARLRAAAQAAAGAAPAAAPEPAAVQRSLNRLNPEISFTGDLLGVATDAGREEFVPRELELDLQSALDPFSRARVTLAVGDEGELEIEELYVTYASLPGGLSLTAGKFRQTFGVLNRQHLHALPQVDYPLALRTYFDDEGLSQTGVSLDWLLPRPWAGANEITFQLTDGESAAFGGEAFERLAVLAHLKNYWDLSAAAYFEWGLSGIAGETAEGGASRVWGTDFSYHWQPPQRAKQRELTWRTELLLSQRDDPFGTRREAWGGYSYVEAMVRQNLYLGVRFDQVDDPFEPSRRTRSVVPFLTWWQSEFVRLRAELERRDDDLAAAENRFTLQLTWAAGPHKHETY